VEHVGSTAVPGLIAKPIIDLDAVLASPADLPGAIRTLRSLGYVHEGDLGSRDVRRFFGRQVRCDIIFTSWWRVRQNCGVISHLEMRCGVILH
jgi:GrpB-like predicted nucleotidyltransferase (UPF0157 family)